MFISEGGIGDNDSDNFDTINISSGSKDRQENKQKQTMSKDSIMALFNQKPTLSAVSSSSQLPDNQHQFSMVDNIGTTSIPIDMNFDLLESLPASQPQSHRTLKRLGRAKRKTTFSHNIENLRSSGVNFGESATPVTLVSYKPVEDEKEVAQNNKTSFFAPNETLTPPQTPVTPSTSKVMPMFSFQSTKASTSSIIIPNESPGISRKRHPAIARPLKGW